MQPAMTLLGVSCASVLWDMKEMEWFAKVCFILGDRLSLHCNIKLSLEPPQYVSTLQILTSVKGEQTIATMMQCAMTQMGASHVHV